ncbi:hypothetical protein [Paraliobacillus sp. JSM ZJ581]|uniref:hypothetical protein n=1 Tax=Paraliobacillus sp. JSM ZJ581 TaxID=3342118 RepID=UPI0035A89C26
MYVVVNAFHWIGYHIIEHLLSKGEKVVGVDTLDSDLKTHLLLSVGRNANFTFREDIEDVLEEVIHQEQTNVLLIDHSYQTCDYLVKNFPCYFIHTKEITKKSESMTYIHAPMIYGEWMPRDKSWFYWNDKTILLGSELFHEKGVSIQIFVLVVMLIMKARLKPTSIQLESADKETMNCNKSIIYIIEKRNMDHKLEKLEEHFQQYHELY